MAIKKKILKKKLSKRTVSRTNPVVESANDIWLAGLGAFALAQKEGAKASAKALTAGSKLFESLVKEGAKVDHKTRAAAVNAVDDIKDSVDDIRDSVENRVSTARKQATQNWGRMEKVFEERVSAVLGRLGVPTGDDLSAFAERVQDLADKVRDITEQEFGKAKARARSARKVIGKDADSIAKEAKKVTRTVKRTVRKDAKKASITVKKNVKRNVKAAKKEAKKVQSAVKKAVTKDTKVVKKVAKKTTGKANKTVSKAKVSVKKAS